MNPWKTFLLAVAAALAAMAMAGASSASAGPVHSCAGSGTPKSPCGAGLAPYTGPRTLHVLGLFTFSTSLLTVECEAAENNGKVTSSGTATENAKGAIEKASWAGCSSSCGSATVAPTGLPWSFEATGTETEVVKGVGAKFTTCGMTCEYKATEAQLEVLGGKEAAAVLNEVPLEKVGGGLLCPSTATWGGYLDLLPSHYGYSVLI